MKILDSVGLTTLWNKIKTYVSGNFLSLNGGTMKDNTRIGGNNLYLGNVNNVGFVYVQDICSQDGDDKWVIDVDGNANFQDVHARSFNGPAASLLTTTAGSLTQPCYFTEGRPFACTYSLNKTVPANAVFTDTHYTASNVIANSATSTSNVTAITNNPYLNVVENDSVRSSARIIGSDGITVNTSADGKSIYINGTPFYTGQYLNNHTSNQYSIMIEGGDGADLLEWGYPMATTASCGFMTAEDKQKVDHLDFNTNVDIESRISNETSASLTGKKIMQLDNQFSLYYMKLTGCNPAFSYGVIGSNNPSVPKVVFPAVEQINGEWITATTIILSDSSGGGPDLMTIDTL